MKKRVFLVTGSPGVGKTTLVNKVVMALKTKGYRIGGMISKEVREDNIKALSLYEKAGYQTIGKLKNYYGKADGLYLSKNLAQL